MNAVCCNPDWFGHRQTLISKWLNSKVPSAVHLVLFVRSRKFTIKRANVFLLCISSLYHAAPPSRFTQIPEHAHITDRHSDAVLSQKRLKVKAPKSKRAPLFLI